MSSALFDQARAALSPRYRLDGTLGSGGMSVVFRGFDESLERVVAIKVLPPRLATAVNVERFVREAKRLAHLSDPHLVAVHDAGEANGLLYYVMDFIEAPTLRDRLAEGPLPEADAVRVADGVLQALAVVHAGGLVHRDVKPENIFLGVERALLADLGIAKSLDSTPGEELTLEGGSPGTPAYMAPEQAAGRPIAAPADLYAVGMVLYEALTGRRWPPGIRPTGADWGGVRSSIRAVLERALEPSPEARWPDAETFREILARDAMPRWLVARRRRVVSASVVVLALAAVGISAWWNWAGPSAPLLITRPCETPPEEEASGWGYAMMLTDRLDERGLRVATPNVAAGYPIDEPPRTLGAELDADYVMTCSVRTEAASVHLAATLWDARTGDRVWSRETLGPGLSAEVQEQLAADIADAIGLGTEVRPLPELREPDPRALQAVTQALEFFDQRTEDPTGELLLRARATYEEALRIEPRFGLALAGLAQVYVALPGRGLELPQTAFARAVELADSALSVGSESSYAYAAKGEAIRAHYWDGWDEAEEAFRIAVELGSSDALAHLWFALWLAAEGRHDEAEWSAREAVALAPRTPDVETGLGVVLYMSGRAEEAAAQLDRTLARRPQSWEARLWHAAALLDLTDRGGALAELDLVLDEGPSFAAPALAAGYAAVGDAARADSLLRSRGPFASSFWTAVAHETLGRRDSAFHYLDAAWSWDRRDEFLTQIATHPLLEDLRASPDYAEFVATHRMPWLTRP